MMEPDQCGGHYVEHTAKVYLYFDFVEGRWRVDPATVDGHPLDAVGDGGPENSCCECGDEAACEQAVRQADEVPLPDGEELAGLLEAALRN